METIENKILVGYRGRNSKEIGSLKFCEANIEIAEKTIKAMEFQLQMQLEFYKAQLKQAEEVGDKEAIGEIMKIIEYQEQLEPIFLLAKENEFTVTKTIYEEWS